MTDDLCDPPRELLRARPVIFQKETSATEPQATGRSNNADFLTFSRYCQPACGFDLADRRELKVDADDEYLSIHKQCT